MERRVRPAGKRPPTLGLGCCCWRFRFQRPSVPLGRFQDLSGLLTHGVSWEMPLKTAVSRETVIQVDICPPAMLVNYDCNSTSRYGVEAWSDYRFRRRGARACRSDEVKTEPLRVSTPDQFAGKPPHWVDSAPVLNLWRSRSTADATLAVRLVADDSRMLGMSGKHQNTPRKRPNRPILGKSSF